MTTFSLRSLVERPQSWSQEDQESLYKALSLIRKEFSKEEKHFVHPEAPTTLQLENFQKWLQQQSIDELMIDFQQVGPEGNGVIARKEIKENDEYFFISYDLLLTSTLSDSWRQVQHDPLLQKFSSCVLALKLLHEACKPNSFWKDYIAVLPHTFTIPLFYTEHDFKIIENTDLLLPAIKLLYNSLKQFFYIKDLMNQLAQPLIPSDKFTLSNYFWALGVVLTRQNEVALNDQAKVLALIPGWDMCNHEPGKITTFCNPDKRMITCTAMRRFAKGEQVRMFYGPRSNHHLLLYSGFVVPSNSFDTISLQITLDISDPLFKIRSMLISKELSSSQLIHGGTFNARLDASGKLVSNGMKRALQITCMNKLQLTNALRSVSMIREKDTIFEYDEETRGQVENLLISICAEKMAQLKSKLSQSTMEACQIVFAQYFHQQLSILENAMNQKILLL
jgi:hypothetical protein